MIRSIIFDLGKVIVPFDFNRAYAGFEAHCGMSAPEVRRRLGEADLYRQFESGQLDPADFVARVEHVLGVSIGYDDFCVIWTSIFLPEPLIGEALLERLARSYRLVLLSNTNAIHFEMIRETYPLLRHFHEFVLSYEVGAMKPSPVIYRKAVEASGCAAEECLFFDDMRENVEAACKEGLQAVRFESAAQLESELRNRGIGV
ncbi:MAG: HAD family phosphatase [Acidobacteriota bacterium]